MFRSDYVGKYKYVGNKTHYNFVDFVISTLFETRLVSTFWNTNIAYSIRNKWTTKNCNILFAFMERGK